MPAKKKQPDERKRIAAGQFKAHCLRLIDQENKSRVPLVITKHGKPMAILGPVEEETFSLFGCMKGTVIINGDIVEGTGEVWEADVV